jgi:uncharacterized protein
MAVKVEKLDKNELSKRGVFLWPIWEKAESKFEWSYDNTEECYFLKGKVILHTDSGEKIEFGKGDFVTFPEGLECTWEITETVEKHYNFK